MLSAPYAHDGWWPDVEAGFATFTPDDLKGTPIKEQYKSLGNDPAHFPAFVRKVISIDLKPYDWSRDKYEALRDIGKLILAIFFNKRL